jgi:hypothetical protein
MGGAWNLMGPALVDGVSMVIDGWGCGGDKQIHDMMDALQVRDLKIM